MARMPVKMILVAILLILSVSYLWQFKKLAIEQQQVEEKIRAAEQKLKLVHSFRSNQWPILQQALCGKEFPNSRRLTYLAQYFFELAHQEVFQGSTEFRHTGAASLFYRLDAWGSLVYHVNPVTSSHNSAFQSIYLRIWKCANDQIRSMNKQMFNDKEHFKGYMEDVDKTPDALRRVGLLYGANKPLTPPCIYTVIRDPISHFLSGYNEVEYRVLTQPKHEDARSFAPFQSKVPYDFHENMTKGNDGVSEDIFYSLEYQDRRKKRFEEFVKDLLQQNRAFSMHYYYYHVYSMSSVLNNLKSYGIKLTGYIPSIKNITNTWPKFMSENCPAFPSDKIPKMVLDGQHESSVDLFQTYKAAKDVWKEKGSTARALCLLHVLDYSCWEDLPDGVPDFCMDVYQKHYNSLLERATSEW